ncbi:hypothetical protein [Leptolyngbya sp. PCC 6406]|uniref:hypothetical protein n=1 Tax=Leptolyngbya sp. PCC 6406 TaxID=1173264 RepID=UPI0002E04793|nr:hypothetical protein [Leptolyngbya sp. PCC 6406]
MVDPINTPLPHSPTSRPMTDFPFRPAPIPFNRLQISDGLLMTADLWEQAHDYHRQRQNFYYQALFQPGIIWGLGVAVSTAPEAVEARYRDQRWVRVQPGVAIDALGNPIVVSEVVDFRLQSAPPRGEVHTIFLVLRYSDPRDRVANGALSSSPETFSLVETTAPEAADVELCRLLLTGGSTALVSTADVLAPNPQELDLRYRQWAQSRPQGTVQLVEIQEVGKDLLEQETGGIAVWDQGQVAPLAQAVPGLYPALAPLPPLRLDATALATADPTPWDWLYLPATLARSLPVSAQATLQRHLAQGGALVVPVAIDGTALTSLYPLAAEFQTAIAAAERDDTTVDLRADLHQEFQAVQSNIASQVDTILQTLASFAAAVGCPLQGSGAIGPDHLLRQRPFVFAGWPSAAGYPLQVRAWGGLIVVVGALAESWRPNVALSTPREQLRSSQEFGVNLLYYGWYRRYLSRLQGLPNAVRSGPSATDSLRARRPGDPLA